MGRVVSLQWGKRHPFKPSIRSNVGMWGRFGWGGAPIGQWLLRIFGHAVSDNTASHSVPPQ
ncbi:hypothetical protein BaRGS_00009390 [Batillaria attramentaria]|uniref:Uncharacterized protein n=1 Tax=Batillaria attramentaria TaxID=370345 RepID=A0ABD0LIT3_9CAEN